MTQCSLLWVLCVVGIMYKRRRHCLVTQLRPAWLKYHWAGQSLTYKTTRIPGEQSYLLIHIVCTRKCNLYWNKMTVDNTSFSYTLHQCSYVMNSAMQIILEGYHKPKHQNIVELLCWKLHAWVCVECLNHCNKYWPTFWR